MSSIKNSTVWLISLLCFGLAVIMFMASSDRPPESAKPLPSKGVPSKYTPEEMHSIWDSQFQGPLMDGLMAGKYPLKKIQDRYNLQTQALGKKYPKGLAIHLVTTYNPEGPDILAGCWITNDQPQIDIVIPKLLDIYYEKRAEGDGQWSQRMQNVLIVSILHEQDHLAFGSVIGSREHPSSLDELVDSESKAWALTCEQTLRPMIEEYQVPLTQSDHFYYDHWIQSGRMETSPAWRKFIRDLYQSTRK